MLETMLLSNKVPGEKIIQFQNQEYWTTLLGEDLLSIVRARGAQRIQSNFATKKDKLNSLLPVAEDWHRKLCFMDV